MHLTFNRRGFIKAGVTAAAGIMFPSFHDNSFAVPLEEARILKFYNIHTRERLDICYWKNGRYLDSELESLNYFFRDFRTGSTKNIDTRLLDLLHAIFRKAGKDTFVHLISGYRSPETNQKLRQNGSGVAPNSLHMQGYAADIRIPGLNTDKLRKIAVDMAGGGVGYYPKSDFVHVDIGRVRQW